VHKRRDFLVQISAQTFGTFKITNLEKCGFLFQCPSSHQFVFEIEVEVFVHKRRDLVHVSAQTIGMFRISKFKRWGEIEMDLCVNSLQL